MRILSMTRLTTWPTQTRSTRRRQHVRRPRPVTTRLRVELLEDRTLLSLGVGQLAPLPPGFSPTYILKHADGVGPLATSSPTGHTPSQIRHAYGFDQIVFNGGISGDGSGTTVAIVDAFDDPKIANDLHQFDVAFGLPDPVFTKVNQRGGSTPPRADAGWASEIALDVEWAHAMAPGANILLVEADDNSYTNLLTAVDYAARQSGVVAVSMSWGSGEFFTETSLDFHFTTPSGHGGVTFVASSVDSGAPPGSPSVSPDVLAVV